jgi:uncharacterized protein (DUF983 family)
MTTDQPGWRTGIGRGLRGRCPACGGDRLFSRFLKVAEQCRDCGTDLHHHRADDLPPYIVILIVGHILGWAILTAETRFQVPLWLHLALWPLLALILCLLLLQPVKGAVVGLQYALGMHGFGSVGEPRTTEPERSSS